MSLVVNKTPHSNRSNMRSGNWNEDENERRTSNWNISPKKAGFKRCGRSGKLKCTKSEKDDDKRNESFTPEEEELIIKLHQAIGSRWPIIAQQIPGRTENEVKNYWNTKLRKKLTEMGIDHVTHRPFSQLLAEYGNISHESRTAPLNREFQNSFNLIPDQGFTAPRQIVPSKDSNSSHDLLAQLQAITLVTDPSKISNNSDCSSSSSTSSSSFSWRDFLVEDPFFPIDESNGEIYLKSDLEPIKKEIFEVVKMNGCEFSIKSHEASSSSGCSFVEAMVDRQNESLLDFPELLEDSFFY